MKTIIKVIPIALMILLFSSCYDRDILERKDFNHSLPEVESLNYTKEGNTVRLTWQIPASIPDDFERPVETSIQVVENNIYRQVINVRNEETSTEVTIDATKNYRFIVKLLGYLTEEAQEEGRTDRVYSEGQVVEVQ